MSADAQAIIRQVNLYFSDRSYPRDKFMKDKAAEVEGGWIPLAVMMTFNKLKSMGSEDEIKDAISKATEADNFQVKEDGTALRRNPDKPILTTKELDKRTVYAKGFDPATITVEIVQKYFDDAGFPTEHIFIRRNMKTKEAKPSAFVQFPSVEMAEKVADEKLEFDGKQLEVYLKDDYFAMKNEQKKAFREEKKQSQKEEKARMQKEAIEATMNKDCVIQFSGATEDTSRENLKDVFEKFGEIAWVDFSRGDTEGYIRFHSTGSASKAVAGMAADGTEINGAKLTLSALEGDEEREYWVKVEKSKQASRQQKRGNGGKRKGGRGGHNSYKRSKGRD